MIQNIEKEVNSICEWIRNMIEETHTDGVVIGNSGGKDCATVIALATKALGKDRVLTASLPCGSISADYDDAKLVSDHFDVPLIKIELSSTYDTLEKTLDGVVTPKEEWRKREARLNMKPRLRMTTLYYLAQNLNYLVMGTGNKCEATVGYTTKWGDNASDFNPIGEFTVEEVYAIATYLGVPDRIIHKAPSDGLGGQTDEEKLGVTYKQIAEYIETGTTEEKALEIIKRKEKASAHKREPIPVYHRLA